MSIERYIGDSLFGKHSIIFNYAKTEGLAICGSLGARIVRNLKVDKPEVFEPGDFDFVTNRFDHALNFVTRLSKYVESKSTYLDVRISSRTTFVPTTCNQHIRIKSPYWKPVCVFIRKDDLKTFFIKKGYKVQFLKQIEQAAEELSDIDKKPRLENVSTIDFDDLNNNDEDDEIESFIRTEQHEYLRNLL